MNFRVFSTGGKKSVAVWLDGHQVATIYPSDDGQGITIMSGRICRRPGAVCFRAGQPGQPPALTISLQDPAEMPYTVEPKQP